MRNCWINKKWFIFFHRRYIKQFWIKSWSSSHDYVYNSYSIRRQFEQELSNAEDDELEVYFKDITLYDLARKFKEAIESKPVISQFELNREPIRLEKQKELILKYQTDSIVDDKLYNLISEGRVRFNKSEISNEPCPIYFVESGDSSLLVENCDEQAFVEFK